MEPSRDTLLAEIVRLKEELAVARRRAAAWRRIAEWIHQAAKSEED